MLRVSMTVKHPTKDFLASIWRLKIETTKQAAECGAKDIHHKSLLEEGRKLGSYFNDLQFLFLWDGKSFLTVARSNEKEKSFYAIRAFLALALIDNHRRLFHFQFPSWRNNYCLAKHSNRMIFKFKLFSFHPHLQNSILFALVFSFFGNFYDFFFITGRDAFFLLN